MGDGLLIELSESEVEQDLAKGTEDAADRGKVPALSKEELKYLFDVFISPYRFIGVEPGNEKLKKKIDKIILGLDLSAA